MVAGLWEVIMNDTKQLFLSVIVAFPLGFVFHYIYRFFHIVLCEQKQMETFEGKLIEAKMRKKNLDDLKLDDKNKVCELSALFELFLCTEENRNFRARNLFWLCACTP